VPELELGHPKHAQFSWRIHRCVQSAQAWKTCGSRRRVHAKIINSYSNENKKQFRLTARVITVPSPGYLGVLCCHRVVSANSGALCCWTSTWILRRIWTAVLSEYLKDLNSRKDLDESTWSSSWINSTCYVYIHVTLRRICSTV